MSIILRLRAVWLFFTGSYPSLGESPFQELDLLVRLRNRIIHNKPSKLTGETFEELRFEYPKFMQYFVDKKLIQTPSADCKVSPVDLLATPEMAEWSLRTSTGVLKGLIQILPEGKFRQLIAFRVTGRERRGQPAVATDGVTAAAEP